MLLSLANEKIQGPSDNGINVSRVWKQQLFQQDRSNTMTSIQKSREGFSFTLKLFIFSWTMWQRPNNVITTWHALIITMKQSKVKQFLSIFHNFKEMLCL